MTPWLLLSLLLLPCAAFALGDQEFLFERPPGACVDKDGNTISGNGKAYACAPANGALGAWIGMNKVLWSATDAQPGRVDPNDVLFVCGYHHVVDVFSRLRPPVDGNATDGPIIVSLNCPSDIGTLDGGGTQARLVWWDSRLHQTLLGPGTIRRAGALDYALSAYDNGQQDRDRFLTVDGVTFRDHLNVTAVFWAWGGKIKLLRVHGINNAADYFYLKGGRDSEFQYSSCREMKGPADCFQQDSTNIANTGSLKINYNYIDKRGAQDIKYGILAGPVNGPTEIIGNDVTCPEPSMSPSGCSPIAIDFKITAGNVTTAELLMLRNKTKNGWRGGTLFRGTNPNFRQQIIANEFCDAGTLGLWLNSTVDNVLVANDTFCRNGLLAAGAGGEHDLYIGKPNATKIDVINNLFAFSRKGLFFAGTMGGLRSHNAYFGHVVSAIEKSGAGAQPLNETELTADPRFLTINGDDDHRLDGPSTLRRAGTPLPECVAHDGQPCTNPPDLGAYQAHHGGVPTGAMTSAAGRKVTMVFRARKSLPITTNPRTPDERGSPAAR